MIAKYYIKSSSFLFDMISTIPIAEISSLFSGDDSSANFTYWFKQLKVFRILRLAKLSRFLQSDSAKTVY